MAEELEGLSLADVAVFVLVGEKGAIFCQFHDHIDDVIFDETVPQLDDMRVIDGHVQVNLPFQKQQFVLVDIIADVDLSNLQSIQL